MSVLDWLVMRWHACIVCLQTKNTHPRQLCLDAIFRIACDRRVPLCTPLPPLDQTTWRPDEVTTRRPDDLKSWRPDNLKLWRPDDLSFEALTAKEPFVSPCLCVLASSGLVSAGLRAFVSLCLRVFASSGLWVFVSSCLRVFVSSHLRVFASVCLRVFNLFSGDRTCAHNDENLKNSFVLSDAYVFYFVRLQQIVPIHQQGCQSTRPQLLKPRLETCLWCGFVAQKPARKHLMRSEFAKCVLACSIQS